MVKNRNYGKIAALHAALLLIVVLGALNMKLGRVTAFLFILLAASAFSSILLLSASKLNYITVIPVALISYFISKNIFFAVFSVTVVIAGTLLAQGLRRDRPRISVIINVALFSGIFAAVLMLVAYLCRGGSFAKLPSDILAFFEGVKTALTENIGAQLDEYLKRIYESAASSGTDVAQIITSESIIDGVVENLKIMSVAIIVVWVNTCAFIAFYAAVGFSKLFGFYDLLPKKNGVFLPSRASAIIFAVSYIFMLISSRFAQNTYFVYCLYLVCLNLSWILLPCFVVMGVKSLVIRYKKRATRKGAVLITALCAVFALTGIGILLAVYLIAFVGAADTMGIYKFLKSRRSGNDENDGN